MLAAARVLNFRPNATARTLTTKRSRIIAIAMSAIGNPVYPFVLDAFSRELQRQGLQSLLLTDLDDVQDAVQRIVQYQCDGVIITAATRLDPSARLAAQCRAMSVPVVLFNRQLPELAIPSVVCRNAPSALLAADLLLEAGHRRFAVIAGPEETSTNVERRDTFAARIREAGHPVVHHAGAFSYAEGHAALLALMGGPAQPDALFCTNDMMALGALDAARYRLGLAVPQDLSIIGFDDVPMASWASYDLTTIRPRFLDMVAATTKLLLDDLSADRDGATAPIEIEADFVKRGSARLPAALV